MGSDGIPRAVAASTNPTDEHLLLDFQQGNRSALGLLVRRHEDRLARIAHRIVGCPDEAEDVRHAVFVHLLRSLGQSRSIDCVGAWLTRCTVNEALLRLRQREREGRLKLELSLRERHSTESTPLQQLQDDESRQRLAVALDQLTADERTLVSLRFDEGLTFREIAKVLERPASTIKSQLSQAIARLRVKLGRTM